MLGSSWLALRLGIDEIGCGCPQRRSNCPRPIVIS